MQPSELKFFVTHRGSRLDYLIPRAVSRKFKIAAFATDFYWKPTWAWLQQIQTFLPKVARRMIQARHNELNGVPIFSWPAIGIRSALACQRARTGRQRYEINLHFDRLFAERAARSAVPNHEIFHGCSYASLETIRNEKKNGVFTILYQFDPGKYEADLVARERALFPEWEPSEEDAPEEYWQRNFAEWKEADLILTNSDWTRTALLAQGVAGGKIVTLPLGYELNPDEQCSYKPRQRNHPLRVLWLGSVILRKGIHYLAQAAVELADIGVEFTIAGPINISKAGVAKCPKNMKFTGAVPRGTRSELYSTHDVFVLPTLSDGFAITQLEAFAHGMPVIATPNCAKVVDDGINGFIVPARDAHALAKAMRFMAEQPQLLAQMRPRCLEAVRHFTVEQYACRLAEVVSTHYQEYKTRPPCAP